MIGLDISLDTNTITFGKDGKREILQHKGKNTALIITNSVGILFNAAWCLAAYLAVKWESLRWTTTIQVLAPISYIMPIVDILLGEPHLSTRSCPFPTLHHKSSAKQRLGSLSGQARPRHLQDSCIAFPKTLISECADFFFPGQFATSARLGSRSLH